MKIKEQLLKEHDEWLKKWVEAVKKYKALLPPFTSVGEKSEPLIYTKEWLAERDSAEKDVKTALAKIHEIEEKLSHC